VAFRDKLFPAAASDSMRIVAPPNDGGAGKTASDTSTTAGPGNRVRPLNHRENGRTDSTSGGNGGKPPSGTQTNSLGRDSAMKPIGTVSDGTTRVTLPSVDSIVAPESREAARMKAIAIYSRRGVPDTTRAKAALLVSGAYQYDDRLRDALAWADSSYRLRNSEQVRSLMNRLREQLGN
jgi:hypothetical protein